MLLHACVHSNASYLNISRVISTRMKGCQRILLCVNTHTHTHIFLCVNTHTHTHTHNMIYSAHAHACAGAKESFSARTCGGCSCRREGRGQWGGGGAGVAPNAGGRPQVGDDAFAGEEADGACSTATKFRTVTGCARGERDGEKQSASE